MPESASGKIDEEKDPIGYVVARLRAAIQARGPRANIPELLAVRAQMNAGTARTWVSELPHHLRRRITSTARGTQTSTHLNRMALLLDILAIPTDDKMVEALKKVNPQFEYPPAAAPKTTDRGLKTGSTPEKEE